VSQATVARGRLGSVASSAVVVGAVALAVVLAVRFVGSSPGRLVLSEQFDGTRLDASRWRSCHWWADRGCTIASNHELESYWPEQARVRDGRLELVAERRGRPDSEGVVRPYMSGMISSGPGQESQGPKLAFRYGRAEIRARIPTGKGLWSAFWLLPADRESKPEIDVMEALGDDPDTLQLHVHWRGAGGADESRGKTVRWPGIAAGWHTYAIDWEPDELRWIVDGRTRWRVRGRAVPHEPMYLVVNLAVGGEWPGAPDAATPFPSALLVDSVKVWR
jgi:beta-glucanase (GH16 family)